MRIDIVSKIVRRDSRYYPKKVGEIGKTLISRIEFSQLSWEVPTENPHMGAIWGGIALGNTLGNTLARKSEKIGKKSVRNR